MADLNSLIAQGVQFKAPPDPFAQYAQMQQLEQGQQANRLNQMKMAEYQRDVESKNKLRSTLSGFTPDMSVDDQVSALVRIGNITEARSLAESHAKASKDTSDSEAARLKAFGDKIKLAGQLYAGATAQNWPLIRSRLLLLNPAGANELPDQFDPAFVQSEFKQAIDAEKQLPTFKEFNVAGRGVQTGSVDPITAQFSPSKLYESSDVISPAAEAQKARIAAAGRAPAQPRTQQVILSDGSLGLMNMATGEITPAVVGGSVAKGKLSAFAEKTAEEKQKLGRDINQAIFELEQAVQPKGLIDQSTGSGIGHAYDVSAGFFGQAPEGAIAAGKLAPIADLVLKMVPRFEGPQSDKDTQSYKEAAGQLSNSALPREIRKAAAQEILRLFKNRKNQFGASATAPENLAPAAVALTPEEQAELEALRNRFKK